MWKRWIYLLVVGAGLVLVTSVAAATGTVTDAVPAMVEPADGLEVTYLSHPPLALPNFGWEAVEGATEYELWVARDITFNDKVTIRTANTRYTPAREQLAFFLDTTDQFFWRVRVSKPAIGEWSNGGMPWSFSKKWGMPSADPPNAPQLLSPDSGAALEFFDSPVFSWTPITGTSYYRLEIARDVNFTNLALTQDSIPFPTFQPLLKLANGDYYWRVTPFNVAGHVGAVSATRMFTMAYGEDPFEAPTLIAPEDNSFPTFTPTFEWMAVTGAQYYRLEYSTDETFQQSVVGVNTRSTSHTPNQFPNDVNYYWRVRAVSGAPQSKWSEVRSFEKHWYIQPQLLTPTSSYQHVRGQPLFSWTSVPGAGYYVLEWAQDQHFLVGRATVSVMHTYYLPYKQSFDSADTWFWRVTPYHSAGHAGIPSVTRSFTRDTSGLAPDLVYPAFYYEPDARFSVHEPVSVSLPIFAWSRVIEGQDFVSTYEIQVDTDPLFATPDFTLTTANAVVVPDWTTPFTPAVGTHTYWRVRSIDRLGVPGAWSERWLVQFDPTLGLTPNAGAPLQLLRPVHASQGIEDIPLLEWWPVQGASAYTVTVATDPAMSDVVFTATAQYPAYAHRERLPYDTYYWQVQASDGGVAVGEPSAVWRFQIAAQDRWRENQPTPMISEAYTKTLVAQDGLGDGTPDLANLYVANDASHWHIGMDVAATDEATEIVILIDVDRSDGSGAPMDPVHDLPVITAHRPEFAIHVPRGPDAPVTGGFDEGQVSFYEYSSGAWQAPQPLTAVGGRLYYTDTLTSSMVLDGFLQVQVELGSLGTPGTVAVQVVALGDGGQVGDTLPPSRPGELDGFVSVSEEVMPIAPPTNATGDPATHAHIPVMRWHPHVDAQIHTTQGYAIQIARDPEFSAIVKQEANFRWHGYTVESDDLDSDNTYYWRARVRHDGVLLDPGGPYNSHPWRFDRRGLIPRAPKVEMLGSSVTFSWDKVEGTDRYFLEWSTDPNFGSSSSADVRAWQHTPANLLAPGTYYWRVRVRQWQGEQNAWAVRGTFTVAIPIPSGLAVEADSGIVDRTPTLTWSPYLTPTDVPRFSAWRYGVEICRDENMSNGCRTATTEQHSWTPPNTFAEGALYWRLRLIDGDGRMGEWTELAPVAQQIVKQYPATRVISPALGESLDATPTFRWDPVNTMAYYRVEIARDELFSSLYDSVETAATEFTPLKVYAPDSYYWRVCVRDKDNNQGPCTNSMILLDPLPYSVFLPLTVRN